MDKSTKKIIKALIVFMCMLLIVTGITIMPDYIILGGAMTFIGGFGLGYLLTIKLN